MHCFIYKGNKKEELYLYIAKQDDFSAVPQAILKIIGTPSFVMELALTPERQLAREKASDVIKGIEENGFFIQLPPTLYPAPKNLQ
ncbi:YcgL domain-containing protein [Methyloprofundus sp.]|uniref:YcgL domain-containing protein n=1 Tax=Methyloprofundus sp. TaxID=2020875 RepID=UPI003D0EB92A